MDQFGIVYVNAYDIVPNTQGRNHVTFFEETPRNQVRGFFPTQREIFVFFSPPHQSPNIRNA